MNGNTLIIDTNLLLLLVVGLTDRRLIERHKRLKAFTVEDYDLLCRIVSVAAKILLTPNTLTETSNLLRQIDKPARDQLCNTLRQIIVAGDEEYVASRSAVGGKEFLRLGLTDSVLLDVTGESRSILTVDLELYLAALNRNISAVNFNHLREEFESL